MVWKLGPLEGFQQIAILRVHLEPTPGPRAACAHTPLPNEFVCYGFLILGRLFNFLS